MTVFINPKEVQELMQKEQTFILNIVVSWCPDCVAQAKNIADFTQEFIPEKVPVYELNVQNEKHVYLSEDHENLTIKCGGHGFPRTVLIKKGVIFDANNVEIISADQLASLACKFKQELKLRS